MNLINRNYFYFLLFLTTGAASSPVIVAICCSDQFSPSRSEFFFAGLFFLASIVLSFRYLFFRDDSKPFRNRDATLNHWHSFARSYFWLPALPFVLFTLWQTVLAYLTLYFGDFDFTLISEAINRTVAGDGILPAPFVSTGESTSFLAHHFSPSLLLLTPVYSLVRLFPREDHFIYGLILWFSLSSGLIIWIHLASRYLKYFESRLFLSLVFAASIPFWRLSSSYHFEALLVPLSGLYFLTLGQDRKWISGILLLFILGLKEDTGLYFALFHSWYAFHDIKFNRRIKFSRMATISAAGSFLFFLSAVILRRMLAGEGGPDWSLYLDFSGKHSLSTWKGGWTLVLSLGLLPLLSTRIVFWILLPILLLHSFSQHPWHSSFYGHYSYSIFPFLYLAAIEGGSKLEKVSLKTKWPPLIPFLLVAGISFFAASLEKETPSLGRFSSNRFSDVAQLKKKIIPNSCVQTQFHFSPQIPLRVRVFPIHIPPDNPVSKLFKENIPRNELLKMCDHYYLFIDPEEEMQPYYNKKQIMTIFSFAKTRLDWIDTSGSIKLFRNKANFETIP